MPLTDPVASPDVIVYTTPLCAPCEDVKRYLRERAIPFRVVDILLDEAAADMLNEHGIFTAPAISIDGTLIEGFDRAGIAEVLG